MGKYRSLGVAFDRIFRNNLNANFDDIDTDILAQKARVDSLIAGTPQPSEVVDARGGKPVLKDRLDGVDAFLAEIATYVNADKTGVVSASSAINTAIANANDGDEIHFHKGTYNIDTPIVWNKKVSLIADGNVNLNATQPMDAIIIATGFTTYTEVHLDNFHFDGNQKANHCIKLSGNTNSNYIVKTGILNCSCINALLDGIIITPSAWTISIKNTYSGFNGRDGIRSITTSDPGNNQLNHIWIDTCTLNNNIESGVNLLGVINTIVNCDIENNEIGVKIDATQCLDPYSSFHVNIDQNYIEGNKTNQIYLKTNTGDGIFANTTENYLNSANLGGAIILCAGISEGITLNYDKNRFETSNTNVIIDGGNALHSKSLISHDLYTHASKFINLGYARVQYDNFDIVMLPASTSTAPSNVLNTTADIGALSPKQVIYPVLVDMQWKLMKLIHAKVVTNATDYNITCTVKIIDKIGTEIVATSFTVTGSGNQTWSDYITNNIGFYRIMPEQFVTVSFLVNSHTVGSYVTINNVCLSFI